jgi:hypothetical protein
VVKLDAAIIFDDAVAGRDGDVVVPMIFSF